MSFHSFVSAEILKKYENGIAAVPLRGETKKMYVAFVQPANKKLPIKLL